MLIHERSVEGITILDITAKLTAGDGAQRLKDKVDELVGHKQTHIIANLEAVPYIDSAGLGQLVASYTTVRKAGGRLSLLNLNSKNDDLLSITKLSCVFDIFADEKEAVASYASVIA